MARSSRRPRIWNAPCCTTAADTRNWSDDLPQLLTPRRRRGHEHLDEPGLDGRVLARSLADVARANELFGGTRAVIAEIDIALTAIRSRPVTLLDIGTGLGDIPERIRESAARRGITVLTYGVEGSETLARVSRSPALPMVRADALALPFSCGSVDIVMCSQLLHHFERDDGMALLREMNRVARHRVIVSDLRRSWLAAAGIWLASFPLHFHPFSRHDGVVSVMRGFTPNELRELVRAAVRRQPAVHARIGFRATAAWTPGEAGT